MKKLYAVFLAVVLVLGVTANVGAIEQADAKDAVTSSVISNHGNVERAHLQGVYHVCDYDKDMHLKWCEDAENVVTDLGANLILDDAFGTATSSYFLGLISSVGYTGIPLAADTMTSHSTAGHVWVEAGNGSNYPLWSTPASNARATITWNSAASRSKAISSAASFTIATTGGTVKGCFIVAGTGAVATNNNTSGTLYSAGVFTGGDKVVAVGDTLQVSYSTSL